MKKRAVLFFTKWAEKVSEVAETLTTNYDVVVIQVCDKLSLEASKLYVENGSYREQYNIIATMGEDTTLTKQDSNTDLKIGSSREILTDLYGSITHKSEFSIYPVIDGVVQPMQTYWHSVLGYFDYSKKSDSSDVFGWDDIFTSYATQKTYNEMRVHGMKVSARNLALDGWVKKRLHYKDRIDVNHAIKSGEIIEFDSSPIIKHNPIFKVMAHANDVKFHYLLENIENNGIFFRSGKTRVQKNYWNPAYNGGVPTTPKKDLIHESTFLFHDLVHNMFPDLIIPERPTEFDRCVYIMFRMMSEAVSLVITDMEFIHQLVQYGESDEPSTPTKELIKNYDFTKRKLYPLYKSYMESDMGQYNDFMNKFCKYVIFGDEEIFVGMDKSIVDDFKKKYDPMICEDYRWTRANWDCVLSSRTRSDEVVSVRDSMPRETDAFMNLRGNMTTKEFTKHYIPRINKHELLTSLEKRKIFNSIYYYYKNVIQDYSFGSLEVEPTPVYNKAVRYLTGQNVLLYRYAKVSDKVARQHEYLTKTIDNLPIDLRLEELVQLKIQVGEFVRQMYLDGLLSSDEAYTFKEVYPIHKPVFAYYDELGEFYPKVKSCQNEYL